MRNHFLALAVAAMAATSSTRAVTVVLDYTYDVANGGNFFGTNVVARNALEAAAADISAAILPSLGSVPTDVFVGTDGDTVVDINWNLAVTNPVTDATVTLNTFSFNTDVIRIYVGMRGLLGSVIGTGGPAG